MASEQATAAANNIASWMRLEANQFPSKGNVEQWATIIDAAFAGVVAERDALRMKLSSQANEIAALNRAIEQWRESDVILRERLGLK